MVSFCVRIKSDDGAFEDDEELLLSKATGQDKQDVSSKLSKVFQLSGFSDPVYAEAYVNVHQYDIRLDGMCAAVIVVIIRLHIFSYLKL